MDKLSESWVHADAQIITISKTVIMEVYGVWVSMALRSFD